MQIQKTANELLLEKVMRSMDERFNYCLDHEDSRIDVFYHPNKKGETSMCCYIRQPSASHGGIQFDLDENDCPLNCYDGNKYFSMSPQGLKSLYGLVKLVHQDQQDRAYHIVRDSQGRIKKRTY